MIIRKHTDFDRTRILELFRFNTPEYFSPNERKTLSII